MVFTVRNGPIIIKRDELKEDGKKKTNVRFLVKSRPFIVIVIVIIHILISSCHLKTFNNNN